MTTATRSRELSLLDAADTAVCEWYVVYPPRPVARWWGWLLESGFRHVELERPLQYGPGLSDVLWLRMLPAYEMLGVEVTTDSRPPWVRNPDAVVQKVTAARRHGSMRDWFHVGPITCVEVVKMALGINAFFVRTPYQLHNYIQRRAGVVVAGA